MWRTLSIDNGGAGIFSLQVFDSPQNRLFMYLCPESSEDSINIEMDAGATYLRSYAQFSLALSMNLSLFRDLSRLTVENSFAMKKLPHVSE